MHRPSIVLACLCLTLGCSQHGQPSVPISVCSPHDALTGYFTVEEPELAQQYRDRLEALFPHEHPLTREQGRHLRTQLRRALGSVETALSPNREVTLDVLVRRRRRLRVQLRTPPGPAPENGYPLLIVLHGGPLEEPSQARELASNMMRLWKAPAAKAGFALACVADTISVRTEEDRFPILRPAELIAIIREIRRTLRVDGEHVLCAGLSLGANYAIAFGCSQPELFAGLIAIAPEGESREEVLRNLNNLPLACVVGGQDKTIRSLEGPRRMHELLQRLSGTHLYRRLEERGHEAFSALYSELLRWCAASRDNFPREIWRVPHQGILPPSRRMYWLESHTLQGLLHGRILEGNRVELRAARTDGLTVWLNDERLELDRPIQVLLNGEAVFEGTVQRSLLTAADFVRGNPVSALIPFARLELKVPATGWSRREATELIEELAPSMPAAPLPYWEQYALKYLEAVRPRLGLAGEVRQPETTGEHEDHAPAIALYVTTVRSASPASDAGIQRGDLILGFDNDRFFQKVDPAELLAEWYRKWVPETNKALLVLQRGDRRCKVTLPLGRW